MTIIAVQEFVVIFVDVISEEIYVPPLTSVLVNCSLFIMINYI